MTLALWIVTAGLLALWSVAAWGLHRLLSADAGWVTELPERLEAWLATVPWGDELERWWPGWLDAMRFGAEIVRSLLGWLGDGALWIVWSLWGLGALALLGGAALLAWLIGYAKRNATPPPSAAGRAAA